MFPRLTKHKEYIPLLSAIYRQCETGKDPANVREKLVIQAARCLTDTNIKLEIKKSILDFFISTTLDKSIKKTMDNNIKY